MKKVLTVLILLLFSVSTLFSATIFKKGGQVIVTEEEEEKNAFSLDNLVNSSKGKNKFKPATTSSEDLKIIKARKEAESKREVRPVSRWTNATEEERASVNASKEVSTLQSKDNSTIDDATKSAFLSAVESWGNPQKPKKKVILPTPEEEEEEKEPGEVKPGDVSSGDSRFSPSTSVDESQKVQPKTFRVVKK